MKSTNNDRTAWCHPYKFCHIQNNTIPCFKSSWSSNLTVGIKLGSEESGKKSRRSCLVYSGCYNKCHRLGDLWTTEISFLTVGGWDSQDGDTRRLFAEGSLPRGQLLVALPLLPQWHSCCFLDTLDMLLLNQGLCTHCFLHLGCSSINILGLPQKRKQLTISVHIGRSSHFI